MIYAFHCSRQSVRVDEVQDKIQYFTDEKVTVIKMTKKQHHKLVSCLGDIFENKELTKAMCSSISYTFLEKKS